PAWPFPAPRHACVSADDFTQTNKGKDRGVPRPLALRAKLAVRLIDAYFCPEPFAAFSNSFRCARNSVSFALTPGSSVVVVVPEVPTAPAALVAAPAVPVAPAVAAAGAVV